jgi:hypothetical protein
MGQFWYNVISSPTGVSPIEVSDVASLRRGVSWTSRPSIEPSLGRRVPWTMPPDVASLTDVS